MQFGADPDKNLDLAIIKCGFISGLLDLGGGLNSNMCIPVQTLMHACTPVPFLYLLVRANT